METILAGVAMFCAIVVVLVALILIARKFLVQSGDIKIGVNGDPDKTLTCPAGGKLLNDLSEKGIFVSSACGGRGACGHRRTYRYVDKLNLMKKVYVCTETLT